MPIFHLRKSDFIVEYICLILQGILHFRRQYFNNLTAWCHLYWNIFNSRRSPGVFVFSFQHFSFFPPTFLNENQKYKKLEELYKKYPHSLPRFYIQELAVFVSLYIHQSIHLFIHQSILFLIHLEASCRHEYTSSVNISTCISLWRYLFMYFKEENVCNKMHKSYMLSSKIFDQYIYRYIVQHYIEQDQHIT